jgi:hypothetical protein
MFGWLRRLFRGDGHPGTGVHIVDAPEGPRPAPPTPPPNTAGHVASSRCTSRHREGSRSWRCQSTEPGHEWHWAVGGGRRWRDPVKEWS